MSFFDSIASLVQDPPPAHVFEFSEAGMAFAVDGVTRFEAFPEGTLIPSPVEDNLQQPQIIGDMLARIAPSTSSTPSKRRTPAALILPDYAARITVLDFDSFPSVAEEQLSLVKFRVKKTVPFDIDSAAVSYWVQPGKSAKGKIDVVAVTVSLEILARYEAVFRSVGFQAGEITTSGIATLNLCDTTDTTVLAKLAGRVLSVTVMSAGRLKLFRCIALEDGSDEEVLSILLPTFAYAEDELGSSVTKAILCGFAQTPVGMPVEAEILRSRAGTANPYSAGLAGYLEGMGA